MIISALASKLRIRPGQTLLILNAPAIFFDKLGALPQNKIETEIVSTTFAFIHLFVNDSTELQKWAALAIQSFGEDTVFWISYPKQTSSIKSDLNRDAGWEVIFKAGYRPVAQVAIDADWSALRFRKGTFSRRQPHAKKANRIIEVPADFLQALNENKETLKVFESFAYTHRKEYVRWIEDARKPETRQRRISKAIDQIALGKKMN